ncbi:MAG: hypothetical protein U0871_06575 [Gemmataceae bacterium]
MNRYFFIVAACAAALGLADVRPAAAVLITFNSDPAGSKANGFVSVDSALVSFTDTIGADLQVGNFGSQNVSGNGLAVFSDDTSALQMNFTQLVNALSLVFGNDDQPFTGVPIDARLTLFNGATQVGQVTVQANGNDIADQTIGFSGTSFDRATFQYINRTGANPAPLNLIEIVDNIEFTLAPTGPNPGVVPAPAGLLLGLLGVVPAGALVRRRRAAAAA